jgi:hypothetical protein
MSATKAHVEALRKYGVAELHNERLAQLARIELEPWQWTMR